MAVSCKQSEAVSLGTVIDARLTGLSISETVDLQGV